jgi:hypothetical protein
LITRLVGVEVDAIQRDVAGLAEALGHCGGIHHLVLDRAEFGDDQLGIDFLVVVADDNAGIGLAPAVETGLGLASATSRVCAPAPVGARNSNASKRCGVNILRAGTIGNLCIL